MKLIFPFLIASALIAQQPTVTSQVPSYTLYAGTPAPGLEIDLGRTWVKGIPSSMSMVQFRLGICKHLDIRADKNMFAIQVSAPVSKTLTVGVLKQWGPDYDKWYFMASQKLSESWVLDVNFDTSKSLVDGSHTETYAGNLYYATDKWMLGLDVAHNASYVHNTTGMVWAQYTLHRRVGIWAGVSRELQLTEKDTALTLGTSLRF